MRTGTRLAVLVPITAVAMLAVAAAGPQVSTPDRLLQVDDLVRLGTFNLPDVPDGAGQRCFEYQQPGAIAFNPDGNSLFMMGHDWTQRIGEVTIPELGGVAQLKQACVDPLEGRGRNIGAADYKVGGLYVAGSRLILSVFSYYDAPGAAWASHFARSTDLSAPDTLAGPIRVGPLPPAFTAGYMAPIPAAWQQALGGTLLTGQCCLSIVSRTSYGPAVSSTTPEAILAMKNPARATPLVGYTQDHPLVPYEAPGTELLWNGTTRIRGVALPEGTASVLFFGRHGWGEYCYGECGTDVKGEHAPPYYPTVWAYDARELARVKSGRRMWSVKPYAMWRLTGFRSPEIGGAAVDPATGRLYISENYGDDARVRIHVFAIRDAAEPPAAN